MSDRKVELDHGSFGTSGHSYQSAWMAHWKQKQSTSKPDSETRDFLPPTQKTGDFMLQTSSSGPDITASISEFSNESRQNSGSRSVSVMNDNLKLKQEKGDNRFFPLLHPSQEIKENVGSSSKITPYEQNCHPIQGLPHSVEDVETMRICTTVDSVENVFGGPPKLHKATHHFMFTKRTGFNLSEGGQVFRESSVSTKFRGKMLSEVLNMSPNFKFQSHQGLSEASAETDTMEMDYVRNNHLSDTDLSPLCKNILGAQNSATSQALVGSTLEGNENDLPCTNIPDINEEPPAMSDVGETSSSRTQSLDMDHLLSHPINFKSIDNGDEITGPDPSCRWAKRLKLSSKGPEPANGAHIGNKLVLKEDNILSSLDSVRKDEEIFLSNPWIRRWCRNAAPQKKAESEMMLSEPERSSFNDFQNKQFPSIAAMALMGKALNGFQPCEFKKKDCLVVWNTK